MVHICPSTFLLLCYSPCACARIHTHTCTRTHTEYQMKVVIGDYHVFSQNSPSLGTLLGNSYFVS